MLYCTVIEYRSLLSHVFIRPDPRAGRMGVNNMQYNKNGNSRSWSSWRILLVLGLFVAVAAFGMLVSQ